jgi:hypothetical protein
MGLRIMQLSDRIGRRIKLQDLHVLMTVVQASAMGRLKWICQDRTM